MPEGQSEPSIGEALGKLFYGGLVLVGIVPSPVRSVLAICAGVGDVVWIVYFIVKATEDSRIEAKKRAQAEKAVRAAAAKREREERARKEKQHRIDTLGKSNASLVEEALASVGQVAASEAARQLVGRSRLECRHRLGHRQFRNGALAAQVTGRLSALNTLSADDRNILTEANVTVIDFQDTAKQRVALIGSVCRRGRHTDASLRAERKDAKLAAQRRTVREAQRHPLRDRGRTTGHPSNSAVDAVVARVQAYREIKPQIDQARSGCS